MRKSKYGLESWFEQPENKLLCCCGTGSTAPEQVTRYLVEIFSKCFSPLFAPNIIFLSSFIPFSTPFNQSSSRMKLRPVAAAASALLLVLGCVVPPAAAAGGGELGGSDSESQDLFSTMPEGSLSDILQELLRPSDLRLELMRQTSQQLLMMTENALNFSAEFSDKLKEMVSLSLDLEEQRLSTFKTMTSLKQQMSTGTFTEEEDAANRKEMRRLADKLKDLTKKADMVPVEVGLLGEEVVSGLLALPEVKAVEQALMKVLLSPFADYV
ncbi:hypothetical protein Esti_001258 [Eimeria stiedai]